MSTIVYCLPRVSDLCAGETCTNIASEYHLLSLSGHPRGRVNYYISDNSA